MLYVSKFSGVYTCLTSAQNSCVLKCFSFFQKWLSDSMHIMTFFDVFRPGSIPHQRLIEIFIEMSTHEQFYCMYTLLY